MELEGLQRVFPGITFYEKPDRKTFMMSAPLGELDLTELKLSGHSATMTVVNTIRKSQAYGTIASHLETRMSDQAKKFTKEIDLKDKLIKGYRKDIKELEKYKHYFDLTLKMRGTNGVD